MLAGSEALTGYFKVIAWIRKVDYYLDRRIVEHLLKACVGATWPAAREGFQVFLVLVIRADKLQ